MDNKIIAVIVLAVLVVAGAGTALALGSNNNSGDEITYNEGSYNILARVNAEGSGIYIKSSEISFESGVPVRNGTPFYSIVDGNCVIDQSNKNAWMGLTFGTPNNTSIQHIQICTIASMVGLEMNNAANGVDASKLNFVANIYNATLALDVKYAIDGGILWEPQYSKIIADGNSKGFVELALTNNLFPNHTCCTIIGSHNYIQNNSDATVRFLAGYVGAVNYVQHALETDADGNYVNTAEYDNLVSICTTYTTGLSDDEIKAALANITYLYADDASGSLSTLTTDIKTLADDLYDLGSLTKSTNSEKLSKTFVNDSYLKDAVDYTYSGSENVTVRVAVIDGDIHQIAIRVAVDLGYFAEFGVDVELSAGITAGGPVADAVIGNQADFGFIGAPPATLKTVNSSLIQVQ